MLVLSGIMALVFQGYSYLKTPNPFLFLFAYCCNITIKYTFLQYILNELKKEIIII